jgi:hypothetical protein
MMQASVSVERAVGGASFGFWLNRKKVREVRRCEGHYVLRPNLSESDPAKLWEYYLQLVAVSMSRSEGGSSRAGRWEQRGVASIMSLSRGRTRRRLG